MPKETWYVCDCMRAYLIKTSGRRIISDYEYQISQEEKERILATRTNATGDGCTHGDL